MFCDQSSDITATFWSFGKWRSDVYNVMVILLQILFTFVTKICPSSGEFQLTFLYGQEGLPTQQHISKHKIYYENHDAVKKYQ